MRFLRVVLETGFECSATLSEAPFSRFKPGAIGVAHPFERVQFSKSLTYSASPELPRHSPMEWLALCTEQNEAQVGL